MQTPADQAVEGAVNGRQISTAEAPAARRRGIRRRGVGGVPAGRAVPPVRPGRAPGRAGAACDTGCCG
ncbi:hypothetical protein FA549_22665 [Pseudomonas aeruginosa]|nr:hypothetical protein [Pseudomonas aeruginosa]MDV6890731.1 hypothetical protein [Pseudomonas aeruginosa]